MRIEDTASDPELTLISARGATGKSTLAAHPSATKSVPLWQLNEDIGVSGHAVEARLRAYTGPEDPVRRFANDSDAFVIVDALDEARMRVSGTSWLEFLDSIAAVAQSAHKFVLLGRERVLEDAWVYFGERGLAMDWLEISHFAAPQRVEYIDTRVRVRGGNPEGQAYRDAQDAVLNALAGSVEEELAEAFIGYAPVLDAVVALLAEGNPLNVANTFAGQDESEGRVDVLLRILRDLLLREQKKTTTTVEELGLEPSIAFRPEEQIAWLAADLWDAEKPALEWCADRAKSDYVTRIREFLAVHPFRDENRWASPVFSAFAASLRFDDARIRPALQAIGDETGLLFEFVARAQETELIDEWQFAALHSSVLAAESTAVEAVVTVDDRALGEVEEPDSTQVELTLIERDTPRQASFELVLGRTGLLELFGPTAFLSVGFPGTVRVSSLTGSLVPGPDCHIRCRSLELAAGNIEVQRRAHGRDDLAAAQPSVVLETRQFSSDGTFAVPPSPDVLELHVPKDVTLRYPWYDLRVELVEDGREETSDERAVRFLNMLMNLLRKHGHGGRNAVYDKKLEGRAVVEAVRLCERGVGSRKSRNREQRGVADLP